MSHYGVIRDGTELLWAQRGSLGEEVLVHGHLADVVQMPGGTNPGDLVIAHAECRCNRGGKACDAN